MPAAFDDSSNPRLLLQERRPVLHHGKRRRGTLPERHVHQEPLTVWARPHLIAPFVELLANLEQRLVTRRAHTGRADLDRRCYEVALEIDVVQLAPVGATRSL